MLQDGVSALLVSPEDPVGMAAAVERVMTDSALAARLAAAARTLARQFEWNTIAERHLEVYRDARAT